MLSALLTPRFGHRRQAPDESEQQAPRLPAPPAPALRLPGPDELMAGADLPPARHRSLRSPAPGPAPCARRGPVLPGRVRACIYNLVLSLWRPGRPCRCRRCSVWAWPLRAEPGLRAGPAVLELAPQPAQSSGAVFNRNTAWFYVCRSVFVCGWAAGTPGGAVRGNRGVTRPWVWVGLRGAGAPMGTVGPGDGGPMSTMSPGDNEPMAIMNPGAMSPGDSEPIATRSPGDNEAKATRSPGDNGPMATLSPREQ